MKIESTNFALTIDEKTICATSLINKITNDEYIKVKSDIPLFYLNGFFGESWVRLNPNFIRKEDNTLYVSFGNRKVFGKITFNVLDGQKLSIKIAVDNQDKYFRVCETVGANIYGLVLGKDYSKNIFVYPHHAGEKTVNPMDRYRKDDYQSFWRAQTIPTDYGTFKREINYCGLASMSFMYLYDDNNGLYLGSHDYSFPVTGLIAEVGSDKRFMGLSFRKHYDFCFGEKYESGEYVLAVNNEDWHACKQIYRDYLAPKLKFHNYPDYLDDQWALNQCYNFKRQGNIIQNKFNNIPSMFDWGKKLDLDHMFIASWNRSGFDTDYPEYYPDMDLGSAMDFVRGLEYVKSKGGIPTLYINARIFDKESNYAATVGEQMAIKNYLGENYEEKYGIKRFTISCPSDNEWKNRLIDTSEFLVKGYGALGVYLDQLGSAEPFPCYSKGHSHAHIGEFNQGYVEALGEIHRRITEFDERTFILTENIGDIYASYTFGNLTWNGPEYDEFYNLMKYVFPEFVQINMVNPRSKNENEDAFERAKFYRNMERAILLGSILWYAPTKVRPDCEKDMVEYTERALRFRKSFQNELKSTVYVDGKYVQSSSASVGVFEGVDTLLVLIGKSDCPDNEIVINAPFEIGKASAYDFDLNSIDSSIKVEGNRLTLTVNSDMSALVIKK